MTKNIFNKNFFLFVGGPGVGKTTTLNELKKKNYRCIDEVIRQIIKEQPDEIASDPEWRKSFQFRQSSLLRSVESFEIENERNKSTNEITFFDRGIPDSLSHPDIDMSYSQRYRYNETAFIFPPWKEIYRRDKERIQSYEESLEVYDLVINHYNKIGYKLMEVPKTTVAERADFIISNAEKLIKQ